MTWMLTHAGIRVRSQLRRRLGTASPCAARTGWIREESKVSTREDEIPVRGPRIPCSLP
jgi:hypothetical protein